LLLRALGSAALVEAWTGHLREAESLGERALGLANEADIVAHPSTGDGLLALGWVAYERGDLDRASHLLEQAASRARVNQRYALLAIHGLCLALTELALGHQDHAMDALAEEPGDPPIPRGIAARRRAVQARVLMASGDMAGARKLLSATDLPASPELRAAAIHLAVVRADAPRVRSLLDEWPAEAEPRPAVDRLLCEAMLADLEQDGDAACGYVFEAVRIAEPEDLVRVFLDAGEPAIRLLRALDRLRPSPYLQMLNERSEAEAPPRRVARGLVEQLSTRELAVLGYLPSRYSNAQIAARLYISTNTMKTHLKHIYRKLGVAGRNEAVETAESLGLL
jgi:LuxR family maltose regulon positive regulatory protein